MKKVQLYTDGACSYNPGPGGWGCVLIYKDIIKEMSGGINETTNNRMEIFAVIQGLKALKQSCEVSIYSDSAYLVNSINNGWLNSWKANGFRTANKSSVKNIDLWKALDMEISKHNCQFIKVKGHANNVNNNRCDQLATGEIKKIIEKYGYVPPKTQLKIDDEE